LKVLSINTYCGSLLVAAQDQEVIGSYEDAGYGTDIARQNFPKLRHVARQRDWPSQDLSGVVVLAHPPCAAFSQQNHTEGKTGLDADKFKCTVAVIDYALSNHCAALCVESVIPALEGAREVHDRLAATHGYTVYRVLQNAISFGVAQWRPRFWCVFWPKDGPEHLVLRLQPQYKSVGQVLSEAEPGPIDQTMQNKFNWSVEKLKAKGVDPERLQEWLCPYEEEDAGILAEVLCKKLNYPGTMRELAAEYLVGLKPDKPQGGFQTSWLRLLAANKYATTILFDSHFVALGRPLSINEYKACMGFPRDYVFPPKYLKYFREYLSRGVCPPVAEWLLGEVTDNLKGKVRLVDGAAVIGAGETADLRPAKGDFKIS
jgi:site-specific DNA-cytosine methylase